MDNKLHSFARSLKKARKENGLSQQELAEILTVNLKTIRNWEQGISKPELNNLFKLQDEYVCDMSYLFGETDTPTRDFPFLMKETGLDKASIIELRKSSDMKKKLINAFICGCDPLVEGLEFLQEYSNNDYSPVAHPATRYMMNQWFERFMDNYLSQTQTASQRGTSLKDK